jgi:hypothetical protein
MPVKDFNGILNTSVLVLYSVYVNPDPLSLNLNGIQFRRGFESECNADPDPGSSKQGLLIILFTTWIRIRDQVRKRVSIQKANLRRIHTPKQNTNTSAHI